MGMTGHKAGRRAADGGRSSKGGNTAAATRLVECPRCGGVGTFPSASGPVDCSRCDGTGEVLR